MISFPVLGFGPWAKTQYREKKSKYSVPSVEINPNRKDKKRLKQLAHVSRTSQSCKTWI